MLNSVTRYLLEQEEAERRMNSGRCAWNRIKRSYEYSVELSCAKHAGLLMLCNELHKVFEIDVEITLMGLLRWNHHVITAKIAGDGLVSGINPFYLIKK